MLVVETPADLVGHAGRELGTSDWILIDQPMIDDFARVTGDLNWFHVDVERARLEMPDGRTIAHGCLTLSLMARMSGTIYKINNKTRGLFYGTNLVRFLAPVQSGTRIRLRETLKEAQPIDGGVRLTSDCVVEREGQAKPAMVAEMIVMAFG
jgi:acyl dehydratase